MISQQFSHLALGGNAVCQYKGRGWRRGPNSPRQWGPTRSQTCGPFFLNTTQEVVLCTQNTLLQQAQRGSDTAPASHGLSFSPGAGLAQGLPVPRPWHIHQDGRLLSQPRTCTTCKCQSLRKDVSSKMCFCLNVLDFTSHFNRKMEQISDI